ncbi:MAG: polyketide cyclase [Candidatus Berkelbacteria bacterium Gr01-1014_85]|uniref:Polyketide cyclase n=1 Tax=Candidatus Berkelbacteria bacterium Gr01-1014_85 TaxID=2017150 RepID=A0A554J9R0_9BACT|nr:MAG: polyketide cyclase [Candidatus Berkelbacteria bacterium Gr01-1014_85]
MNSFQYRFKTEYRFSGDFEALFERIANVVEWPNWWSSVVSVKPITTFADPLALGTIYEVVWRGFLPYQLAMTAELVAFEPKKSIKIVSQGDMQGQGHWQFVDLVDKGDKTLHTATYLWEVNLDPQKYSSPIWRSFGWLLSLNHHYVMSQGALGLSRALGFQVTAKALPVD